MTAHELARKLLEGPDLPVIINGWGSDEGFAFEVTQVGEPHQDDWFLDSIKSPRSSLVIAMDYESLPAR